MFTSKMPTSNSELIPESFENLLENSAPTSNLVFSPTSLRIGLLSAFLGAKSATATQILSLSNSTATELLSTDVLDLFKPKLNIPSVQFSGNIYSSEDTGPTTCFIRNTLSTYEHLAFYFDHRAADEINKWISDETQQRVKGILPNLSKNTFLALTHTFDLQLRWACPFKTLTKLSFEKMTMHQYGDFLYGDLKDLNAVAMEMDFETDDTSMLVLMPNDNNLKRLGKQLLFMDLSEISKRLEWTELSLYFPKLNRVGMARSMKGALQTLGMKDAFTEEANFGRLHGCGEDTYVKDIRHHGRLDLGRDDVRLVAVTGMQWDFVNALESSKNEKNTDMLEDSFEDYYEDEEDEINRISLRSSSISVLFDRHFFYAVIHKKEILFVGVVAQ